MRQRRAKIYRKMLHQYQLQFGFREPYQLLIDDTFSLALSRYKISDPLHQFSNVLQTKKIKPLISQCCMAALYALGKEHQSTVDMAKQWERRMCNHREAIAPLECIKQCVGAENKHRYIVASEQAELRRDLRLAVPGVPMMHFTQAVMVLEPMSALTKSRIEDKEETKLSLPASEAALLSNQPKVDVHIIGGSESTSQQADDSANDQGEAGVSAATTEPESASARKRKRKAPNPLSMRKPKTPKLSMEQKLQREQEIKKQKQRLAARARQQASQRSSDNAAPSEGAKRKRKRSSKSSTVSPTTPSPHSAETKTESIATTNKTSANADATPTANTNANASTGTAPNSGVAKKRRRSKKSSSNAAAGPGTDAPAAVPTA